MISAIVLLFLFYLLLLLINNQSVLTPPEDEFDECVASFLYGERDPMPKGYAIRTGLSDLLKSLNSEYGVTAKEDSIGTYAVMISAILLLFLFYLLLLLINNHSVLLPPEDEFDEFIANFAWM